MHKLTNFRHQDIKLFEMVTFGRKKNFLDSSLVYNRFCFQILRPTQQKLELAVFGHFEINFVYFLIFEGLSEKFFDKICT